MVKIDLTGEIPVAFPENYGFCGGVVAANDLLHDVSAAAEPYEIPVVAFHDIVHNDDVRGEHERRGVRFVDAIEEIPEAAAVVPSAHGVSPTVIAGILGRSGEIFDATCPLVIRTHRAAEVARQSGAMVLYVCKGKPGEVEVVHDEVLGMEGHLDYILTKDGKAVHSPVDRAYLEIGEALDHYILQRADMFKIVTQTTLDYRASTEYAQAIRNEITSSRPDAMVQLTGDNYVCKAVHLRQLGVEEIVALKPTRIVVVTSPESKNGMGYADLAKSLSAEQGLAIEVVTVASAEEARALSKTEGLTGVTASASTPNASIRGVVEALGGNATDPQPEQTFTLRDSHNIPERMQSLAQSRRLLGVA